MAGAPNEDSLVLLEQKILSVGPSINQFVVVGLKKCGANGAVFVVRSNVAHHPFPEKLYALKMMIDDQGLDTNGQRKAFSAEFQVLAHRHPHPNVIEVLSSFRDEIPDELLALLHDHEVQTIRDAAARTGKLKSQFTLFPFHDHTLKSYLVSLKGNSPEGQLPLADFALLGRQLFDAELFLEREGIVHRDMKLDNMVVSGEGSRAILKVIDFGTAIQLPQGGGRRALVMSVGGNPAHLAPEVLHVSVPCEVDYIKQWVFECGVLLYEMLFGSLPFASSHDDSDKHDDSTLACETPAGVGGLQAYRSRGYPVDHLISLLKKMLASDPAARITLSEACQRFHNLFRVSCGCGPELYSLRERCVKLEGELAVLTGKIRTARASPDWHTPLRSLDVPFEEASGCNGMAVTADESRLVMVHYDCTVCIIPLASDAVLRPVVFGSRGKGSCQFDTPVCMALSSHDTLLVVESSNRRVQEITLDGVFVRFLLDKHHRDFELSNVSSIACKKNVMALAWGRDGDTSHVRVLICEYRSGDVLRKLGTDDVRLPGVSSSASVVNRMVCASLAFSSGGEVLAYVNEATRQVLLFLASGELFQISQSTPLTNLASVAFTAEDRIVVVERSQSSLVLLSPYLNWLPRAGVPGPLLAPKFVCAGASGRVYVFDCGSASASAVPDHAFHPRIHVFL